MGALLRFLTLSGVLATGSYMLYQTQAKLADPGSLVEDASQNESTVVLGPASDSEIPTGLADLPGQNEPSREVSEIISTAATTEPDPFALVETTKTSETVVMADKPAGLDFREQPDSDDPFAVRTADASSVDIPKKPAIRLASNDEPFELDDTEKADDPFAETPVETKKPADAFPELTPEQDPFTSSPAQPAASKKPVAADAGFPGLDESSKPTPQEDTFFADDKPADKKPQPQPKKEVDPFGDFPPLDNKKPVVPADKFPGVEPAAKKPLADPFGDDFPAVDATPKKPTPAPVKSDDPFADDFPALDAKPATKPIPAPTPKTPVVDDPFADDFPALDTKPAPRELIQPKPAVKDDPFGEFPPLEKQPAPVAPKPETPTPADDPFGDSFPGLSDTPTDKKETAPPVAKPVPTPDPFGEEFPPLKTPVERKPTVTPTPTPVEDPFPAFAPSEKPTPAADDNLPGLDAFDKLDSSLKSSATKEPETEMPAFPEISDEEMKPAPEAVPDRLPEAQPGLEIPSGPEVRSEPTPAPRELEATPDAATPTADELRGSGIVKPDTPRGTQLPQLEIHKKAPDKAVLNKPFVYSIHVKNVGQAAADEVTVQDQIPRGSNLAGTIPQAEMVGNRLVWKFGRMKPGEEKKIAVKIVPVEAGPIGSVATVNFVAEVGAETVIQPPQVTFKMEIPKEAKVGEVVSCVFEIVNSGRQPLTGIILRDMIPAGLHHPAGGDLENPLGDLGPGEKLVEQLELKVVKPGQHVNKAVLTAEGGLQLEAIRTVVGTGSNLSITRRGPKQRFVGRAAAYESVIENVSEVTVSGATLVEEIPDGMEFVEASEGGQFHSASNAIFWRVPDLAPGETLTYQSKLIAKVAGNQESIVRVVEKQGAEIQTVAHTTVEKYAAIGLEVSEHDQPILVGDKVIMRVEATNRGNANADNVQLQATIPPTMQLMNVRGRTRYAVRERSIVFEPLTALEPGKTEIIELELQAAAPSNADVSVSIQSGRMKQPLSKVAAFSVHSRQ